MPRQLLRNQIDHPQRDFPLPSLPIPSLTWTCRYPMSPEIWGVCCTRGHTHLESTPQKYVCTLSGKIDIYQWQSRRKHGCTSIFDQSLSYHVARQGRPYTPTSQQEGESHGFSVMQVLCRTWCGSGSGSRSTFVLSKVRLALGLLAANRSARRRCGSHWENDG